MSVPFFYLPPEQWNEYVTLDGQEARHLAQSLRMMPGAHVGLLDGQGRWGQFAILSVAKKTVRLVRLCESLLPPPKSQAIVALAASKVARRGFFMEKAAELGAHALWLWQGDRSQAKLSPGLGEACQGQLIAGAKQCANPWLPTVRILTQGVDGLVSLATTADRRFVLRELQDGVALLTAELAGQEGKTVYVIGPEGGFSERELVALERADFAAVSLGGRILRCETAATLCLGLHWWAAQQADKPDAARGTKCL
ncbi:MAG: 16S rRNA (uracil(1498)-N(3))-methyltransferase [Desulfovibrio sp.]|nr:16S rRNA (uracil(1498)-N(3))-methyltransferase [Desulfovibrio sp.]